MTGNKFENLLVYPAAAVTEQSIQLITDGHVPDRQVSQLLGCRYAVPFAHAWQVSDQAHGFALAKALDHGMEDAYGVGADGEPGPDAAANDFCAASKACQQQFKTFEQVAGGEGRDDARQAIEGEESYAQIGISEQG